jgi:GTP-binding protein HflX
LHDNLEKKERAFLVGVRADSMTQAEAESLLAELRSLAKSLGVEIAGSELIKLRERHAKYLCGEGKAEEVKNLAADAAADSLIFDEPLSPTQQRNWEELTGLGVYDREELIIKIFASRAKTREASLQTELARLQYALPRLSHSYADLSRQRGGRYGTKGSGEQKLELDRREIKKRIIRVKDELKNVRQDRDTQRKKREALPTCALVGYTNAGKSSLLNTLTKAGVVAEDKLFVTLDTTTRRLSVGEGNALLVTDTVGFVRRLPHALIEAFKATLEETINADFLVLVLDCADPDIVTQCETTRKVLGELGAGDKQSLVVLNKSDLLPATDERRIFLLERYPDALFVSTKNQDGMASLAERLRALALANQRPRGDEGAWGEGPWTP